MMLMHATEMEWRCCPRFPNYEVSDCGDFRRGPGQFQPGRRLNGFIDPGGYIRYSIDTSEGRTQVHAHVMVAEAFIGPSPGEEYEVAHNNGSRLLNVPSNLRWATPLENVHDRFIHGTAAIGVQNPRAKITDEDVRYIRRRYVEIKVARGDVAELDRKFNLSRSQIIKIVHRDAWAHVA